MREAASCSRQDARCRTRHETGTHRRRNLLRHQRRHMGRKRLRRRQLLALRAALRHGALLDRPYRLAGVAVEHEHKTLLGRLDHDVAHALAGVDARQRRLRRQVVIPDIVMHGLERPDQFAGLGCAARPRNWRARCCRAACRPRNPGSATSSAGTPARAPRPPTSAPRHWRGRRRCRHGPADRNSSAARRSAHRRRARCRAAHRRGDCPRSRSRR